MPLGSHRQRVPAMLAVACAGMLVYAVAGASPDGRQLAPASCSGTQSVDTTTTTSCSDVAAASTAAPVKGSSGSTSTTTGKGANGSTTSTTDKGSGASTTSTTGKGGHGSTTTTTTGKGSGGSTTSTTGKGGHGSTTTTTTGKGGKDSTTTTTRKGGGGKNGGKNGGTTPTTTKDSPTTSTTTKGGTVSPNTSTGDPSAPGGSSDPGASSDPGGQPIAPQAAPPADSAAPAPDSGPAADPEAAADPGPAGGWGNSDTTSFGPVEADAPITPMAVPGSGSAVLPMFGNLFTGAGGKTAAALPAFSRPAGQVQQVAAPALLAPESVVTAPAVTESSPVSRSLAGLQTSVTEQAFPATIISTPKVFPVNRWDPLAASLLVVMAGLAREGIKAWRRRASQIWPI